jgi:hypothetical protein
MTCGSTCQHHLLPPLILSLPSLLPYRRHPSHPLSHSVASGRRTASSERAGATSSEGDGATGVTTTMTGGADEVQGRRFHGRRSVASPDRAAQPWPGTAWGPTPRRTGLPYPGGSPSPWVVARTGGRRRPVTLGREGEEGRRR